MSRLWKIALAAVVMLTSCFNFTNLSIARSLTRAREIGGGVTTRERMLAFVRGSDQGHARVVAQSSLFDLDELRDFRV